MPSVNSLRNRFESIAQEEPVSPDKQRVRVKSYDMPLRQSTLSFGAMAQKLSALPAVTARPAQQEPSPEMSESEGDTIVVKVAEPPVGRSLPTPSESATDASSEVSTTPKRKTPVRSRSKRVSSVRKSAPKTGAASPAKDTTEKQRNISGETLVPEQANMSQTSLLKSSIDALDMSWDVLNSNLKSKVVEVDTRSEASSTATVVQDEQDGLEDDEKCKTKRVKKEHKDTKWEQRLKRAETNSTRRSSRASLLMSKATEVVSAVTSTVLGKRSREAKTVEPTITEEGLEPETKKTRVDAGPAATTKADDVSLTTTNRNMRSRSTKDKKWLVSGLYAGQKRTFDASKTEAKNRRKSQKAQESEDTPNKSSAPQKDNYVLPLPMFAGERLLEVGRDFKLPFDIFSPLPTGHPQPEAYRKVNHNVFIGDAADQWRHNVFSEHSTCMCSPSTGCDTDCMNRFMYYECDSKNCRLTPSECGNRAFEGLKARTKKGGKFNVGVEVYKTSDRGYGVRSARCFEPGQVIVEYTGEIITQEECENRMRNDYKQNECYYLMAFDQNMIIDATRGSLARFVNHSCDPNCKMEKWTVGGKPRMALFAGDRGIMTGEELTYDYNFDPYSQKNVQVCRCGSENCRGVLGPKPKEQVLKELQRDKESKLAGAKRKLGEILEESTNLLNKKRKVDEKPRLPKGWAYFEPVSKKVRVEATEFEKVADSSALTRQPSKLKRMLSQKSKGSSERKRDSRIASTNSEQALIVNEDEDVEETGTFATSKARANSLKKNVGRSLRRGK